jgi:hypothetical protein
MSEILILGLVRSDGQVNLERDAEVLAGKIGHSEEGLEQWIWSFLIRGR